MKLDGEEEVMAGDERWVRMGPQRGKRCLDEAETAEEAEGLRRRRRGVSRGVEASLCDSCGGGGGVSVGKAREVRKRVVVRRW